jgi:hypothetical protein
MRTQPGLVSIRRAARSASTGRGMSCSASKIVTRSYRPETEVRSLHRAIPVDLDIWISPLVTMILSQALRQR